jgi:hypothetical protein
MKYIKTFENSIQPQFNDYVVAYRPYRVEKDSHLEPIKIDYSDHVLDIGQILKVHPSTLCSVHFLTSKLTYLKTTKQILFYSSKLEEAEKHLQAILNSNKFNI